MISTKLLSIGGLFILLVFGFTGNARSDLAPGLCGEAAGFPCVTTLVEELHEADVIHNEGLFATGRYLGKSALQRPTLAAIEVIALLREKLLEGAIPEICIIAGTTTPPTTTDTCWSLAYLHHAILPVTTPLGHAIAFLGGCTSETDDFTHYLQKGYVGAWNAQEHLYDYKMLRLRGWPGPDTNLVDSAEEDSPQAEAALARTIRSLDQITSALEKGLDAIEGLDTE